MLWCNRNFLLTIARMGMAQWSCRTLSKLPQRAAHNKTIFAAKLAKLEILDILCIVDGWILTNNSLTYPPPPAAHQANPILQPLGLKWKVFCYMSGKKCLCCNHRGKLCCAAPWHQRRGALIQIWLKMRVAEVKKCRIVRMR